MATQRYISTSFYDDTWIHRLDPSEKFMYMYLLTNGLTNIAGVYKIGIDRMVYDTGFNENTVKHVLEKFEKAGKAFYHLEYMILPSWPKHQRWEEKSKIKVGIDAILKKTPREIIAFLGTVKFCYDLTAFGGIAYDSLSLGTNYSDLDSNSDLDSDNTSKPPKKTSAPAVLDPLFHPIQDAFLSVGKFADYRKEAACIKAIIKKVRNLTPDSPESTTQRILETFHKLTRSQDRFYSSTPFLPSGLSPILERVWAVAQKSDSPPSTSWMAEVRAAQR